MLIGVSLVPGRHNVEALKDEIIESELRDDDILLVIGLIDLVGLGIQVPV
jgi:hypothetical protein